SFDTEAVGASLLAMVVTDAACCLNPGGAFESIASKLAPTGIGFVPALSFDTESVGAGLLAMVVNDDAGYLVHRGALEFIAGKPAPTVLW
ncbi:MAG: hypothetical protein JWP42_97, partial [Pseudomonas sp.]|nr:hypothetical protein [Pseudomonas sp.]